MTRVALTGGTGFIGANLVRALLRRGDEVHLLNRAEHAMWRIAAIRDDVAMHVVDIAERDSVRTVLDEVRPEVLFHLAQSGGYSWQTDIRAMVDANLTACVNLLGAAERAGTRVVVNAGTSSEYGAKPHASRETDRLEPNSDYAATKAAGTLYCQQWARRKGLPVPTLRLYSIYGPFEEPMRLLPRLIAFGLEGRFPALANPHIMRDLVYVDDAVEALLRVADAGMQDPGAIFNVCSGRSVTLREIVSVARSVLGIGAEPEWGSMAPRAWDTDIWVGDPHHTASALGWRATTTLETGFRQFADWLRNEPAMLARYRSVLERS